MKIYRQTPIIKIVNTVKTTSQDLVVTEIPLKIKINRKKLLTLICLPSDLEDLIYGFLFSNGIIQKDEDIKKLNINTNNSSINVTLTKPIKIKKTDKTYASSGSKEFDQIAKNKRITAVFKISASYIIKLTRDFLNKSDIYSKTGGVHSAALTDGKKIMIFKDDIGRHNAIDKIIGEMLRKNISSDNKALLTSGRVSSEIIAKIHRAGVPVIISKSAPTDRAIDLAKKGGVTLIKAAKSSVNVYCNEGRVSE
ncbi:MAG: formate dehydrogenase accessory sulfurtransferase FdhD [Candidatus Omnitrophota bacterium]|nr:formate dehydrogenase accessory sulfurtransferase FdhD [Candidatus Omnitrophota bacterium]